MNKQVLIGLSTLSLVTILSGIALSSSNSSAASASTATASVKVASACTMSVSGGGSYSATIPNGTSSEITGSTFTVTCNDANGFALYAVGNSNNTLGNTNLVGTSTNIATNTSGNDSYWAMKVNPTSGNTPTIENSFNDYHVVPNAHTKVASYNQSTGSGSLAVQATYKASISTTQLAGNYTGQVKYTLVHPTNETMPHEVACEAGKICYNPNTITIEGQMGKQSASNNASVTLYASNFKRDGYGFAGWNTAYDGSGTTYGPNQTITTPADTSTNGLSLYAVWIPSNGTLQNWNGCSSLSIGDVTALTDNRDNDTYAVAKLADGNCWTIENLRLDSIPELSSANTHNPSLLLTNIYNSSTTSNHLSPTSSVAYDATTAPEGWCTTYSSACIDQSRLRTDNTVLFTNNTTSSYSASSNVYSYGNYYNWYSATAGHGKYGSSYSSSFTSPGDICPAGWHLPTGKNASGDFGVLDIALGGTGASSYSSTTPTGATMSGLWRSYPNNFVYSGFVNGASVGYRNSEGDYLSASGANINDAYNLPFISTSVSPGTGGGNKYDGGMVRCISGV